MEYPWERVLAGDIDWIVSDHACCRSEIKYSAEHPDDIWLAKSGFGGTEYLLSGVHSEGRRRGLSPNRMAELLSWNPARRFGLHSKGDLAPGYDADLVLFDPDETFTVRAAESPSRQGYTPFEGQQLIGRVKTTFLRGSESTMTDRLLALPAVAILPAARLHIAPAGFLTEPARRFVPGRTNDTTDRPAFPRSHDPRRAVPRRAR